jgi:hypothetical protein
MLVPGQVLGEGDLDGPSAIEKQRANVLTAREDDLPWT